jgi:hypothetical protein
MGNKEAASIIETLFTAIVKDPEVQNYYFQKYAKIIKAIDVIREILHQKNPEDIYLQPFLDQLVDEGKFYISENLSYNAINRK